MTSTSRKRRYPWRLAVITGAASGIGRCFAEALAADGCRLLLIDRNEITLPVCNEGIVSLDTPQLVGTCHGMSAPSSKVQPTIGSQSGHAMACPYSSTEPLIHTLQLDLTEADAADKVMAYLDAEGLQPNLLINNAGIFDFKAVSDLTPGRIDTYIDLHMRAVTHLSRQMAMRMAAHGGGSILNMSSMSCWMPMPGIALYAATKAYIRVFSRALNVEMRGSGVTVTVACPGGIATDLFGLPRSLQRLGVRVGALTTPEKFVRNALRRCVRRKAQYINGLLNRIAIPSVAALPTGARHMIKTRLLDHQHKK